MYVCVHLIQNTHTHTCIRILTRTCIDINDDNSLAYKHVRGGIVVIGRYVLIPLTLIVAIVRGRVHYRSVMAETTAMMIYLAEHGDNKNRRHAVLASIAADVISRNAFTV